MRKLAIALSKGGVGKTTTAINLAASLAKAGKSVLLIDADTQGQVSKSLGVKPEKGLAEFITGDAQFQDACILVRENMWLLSGGRSIAGVKRLITRKDTGGERILAEKLREIDHQYAYVILDSAPGWDELTINILYYTNSVLSPVSLEVMTLHGLMEFSRSMVVIQKYNPELQLKYILPTFFDRRVRKSEEILPQLVAHFGDRVCPPIRYSVRLSEAPGYGQTIFEYAPHSTGAEDYHKLTERIISDE